MPRTFVARKALKRHQSPIDQKLDAPYRGSFSAKIRIFLLFKSESELPAELFILKWPIGRFVAPIESVPKSFKND